MEDTYEWLVREVEQVRWKKFFLFNSGVAPEPLAAVEVRFGPLPNDYTDFIKEFGEARLFRHLQRGSYQLAVFSRPRIHEGRRGELLLEIGFFLNGGYAHFRKLAGNGEAETGVFEGAGVQVRKVAESFEEWLKKRFERAKKLYKKSEWKRILEGALPFSSEELLVVAAMNRFSFERVGTASNGDMLIRVSNDSKRHLPYLTVGAKAPGRLDGAVYLDISDIGPGESKTIAHDCYKSLVEADKIELFRKPPPEPEEREMFYEFGVPHSKR